jgi:hypothetical protein
MKLLITDDIIVLETNRYAAQSMEKEKKTKAQIHTWKDTDQEEVEVFLRILLWMG